MAVAFLVPSSACILPDTCILIYTMGKTWCASMEGAMKWPAGQAEQAKPILSDEYMVPRGCTCVNDIEHEILTDQLPADAYAILRAEIEGAARENCLSLSVGLASNCLLESDPNAPTIATEIVQDGVTGPCVGNCEYFRPPAYGECPDPDPFECEDIVDDAGNDEADDGACPIGADGCPCTAGGACDSNLECVEGMCLPLASDDEADSGVDLGPNLEDLLSRPPAAEITWIGSAEQAP